MKKLSFVGFGLLALLVLAGCGGMDPKRTEYLTADKLTYVYQPSKETETLIVDVGSTPRDVYLVFSNISAYPQDTPPRINGYRIGEYPLALFSGDDPNAPRQIHDLSEPNQTPVIAQRGYPGIHQWNLENLPHLGTKQNGPASSFTSRSPVPMKNETVGIAEISYYEYRNNGVMTLTLRSQHTVSTPAFGQKRVNVWVEQGEWSTAGGPVDQDVVDNLRDKFLTNGTNDIYGWVTNIFGEEYGSHSYSDLIAPTDTIDILLFDIEGDGGPDPETGYVVGYYWARDQSSDDEGSAKRVLFALDSRLASAEDPYWRRQVVSTLAHEFQHMINFYQRALVLGKLDPYWMDELLSMAAEDLVATKIQVDGPRGVPYSELGAGSAPNGRGRLPLFNAYSNDSVAYWPRDYDQDVTHEDYLRAYAVNYAFGAFLSRNFGGAKFFSGLYKQPSTGFSAMLAQLTAMGYGTENLGNLFGRWAEAVVLSDKIKPGNQISYNLGSTGLSTSHNGVVYRLGSINLFNYYRGDTKNFGPDLQNHSSRGTLKPYSNTYLKVAAGVTGKQSFEVSIPNPLSTSVTLVVK